MVHVCASEEDFWELVLFFHNVDSRDQTQIIELWVPSFPTSKWVFALYPCLHLNGRWRPSNFAFLLCASVGAQMEDKVLQKNSIP